ncbi:MAG TPA: asparagine synthase-related protein [Xanthobacteraceae bacterium]|nr:asparagine synthase-related protein [Xanthobacteraceae bacterium]
MGRIGGGFDAALALPWLRRRGPDSQNVWSTKNGAVNLLHCRLSIVDEHSRSDQPFRDPATGIVVVLNGEIYNYRSLWQRYADFPFRTRSDTEVIVAAYLKEGIVGLKQLNGMFALALIDERRGTVVLARDAVGKKPLYVFKQPNSVLFGSSLLPLIACSGTEPLVDTKAAAFYWRRGYVSPDMSAVNGAQSLLPGEALELDFGGNVLSRRRIEPDPLLRYSGESLADVRHTIRDLIVAAIDRRLENNPQPMALLSGGIDSTIVTQLVADRLKRHADGRHLQVITLGAMIPYTQDEYYARYAAKRLGLPLKIVRPSRQRLPEAIRRAIALQDEPLGMPSYFFLFQLIQAIAPYGRVLFTGDGGDEVFLGYRHPPDWQSHALADDDRPFPVRVGPGPSPWMGSWARDVAGNTLLGHMFTKVDRASAEQAVEIRSPLLDLSLMTYMRSLPAEILCRQHSPKAMLKEQLSDWPQWFLERPKLGFSYNLRWHWALTRFGGLREMISPAAIETFSGQVPRQLRGPPKAWTSRDIFHYFGDAWRLMMWSGFLDRLSEATRQARTVGLTAAVPVAAASV